MGRISKEFKYLGIGAAYITLNLPLRPETPTLKPFERRIFYSILQKRKPFDEYMEMCLYSRKYNGFEGGYYSSGKVIFDTTAKKGHYNTYPQKNSPLFGQGIVKQLVAMWKALDRPNNFLAVNMGAGNGIMDRDILMYTYKYHRDFFESLKYVIVEISKELMERQEGTIASVKGQDPFIKAKIMQHINFINRSAVNIEFDEPITGCFISNELLDNLPVKKLFWDGEKYHEIYVSPKQYAESSIFFCETKGRLSSSKLKDYLKFRMDKYKMPQDSYLYVNLNAIDLLQNISKNLKRGYVITIDCGKEDLDKYIKTGNIIRTYGYGISEEYEGNPYYNPGNLDIAASVDFGALMLYGEAFGLKNIGCYQQNEYFDKILLTPLNKWKRNSKYYRVLIQSKNASL